MKPSNVCLLESEIPLLLSGDLPPDEAAAAEIHIAECAECRGVIESVIADSQWWDDACHSLAAHATRLTEHLGAVHDMEPATNQRLLELLGPTDDPAMMGRIGVYEIVGILGHGGMGVVFKGYDGALHRFVAIKMLLPHLATSGAARKRFAREAQAAAAVVDDHVMAIHGVSEWMSAPYFVMPYARGMSLQKRLSQNGPLEVREILRIGMQAAKGLAAAHAQGLVHRDVKPANIFLDEGVERVRIMDFGLARAVDDASLTRSGTLAGTPQFMSPEQARAETVDYRSDLFSLGSVMYSMCTGHTPFRAESSYGVLRLITDKEPRSIRETNPDIPDWLCSIIFKLMAKHADDRFESAAEVAELLEECLAYVQQPTMTPLPVKAKQLSHLLPAASHDKDSPRKPLGPWFYTRPPIGKFIAAAAFALSIFFVGVLIVLETSKGTLRIESEADNVPIRIRKGAELVERLTLSKSGATTHLQAGEYTIEIEDHNDQYEIVGNQISLTRGKETLAKITFAATKSNGTESNGDGDQNPSQPVNSFSQFWDAVKGRQPNLHARSKAEENEAVLTKRNEALEHTLEQIFAQDFPYVQGRITEVADGSTTVWINLGSADGLRTGVSFGVFDSHLSLGTDARPKARIEVVSILTELPHLSRCKVFASPPGSMIQLGDFIYSATWHPSSKNQFYLLGKMDWNGDGKDDKETIKTLIRQFGGEVADLSVNTRFMIVGDEPKAEGDLDADLTVSAKEWVDAERKAKALGVARMSQHKLKNWLTSRGAIEVLSLDSTANANPSNELIETGLGEPVEVPGIRVTLRLDAERHSKEMLTRNIGFNGLSLMGSGLKGWIDDKLFENMVTVLAHGCRLESFQESGPKYFDATFFVPQGPKNDSSNRGLTQKRLDEMQEGGIQFWLDHDRDQLYPKGSPELSP